MVDSVLGITPDSRGTKDNIVTACLQLPLCGFATPETWSGMRLHFVACHHIPCVSERCALAAGYHIVFPTDLVGQDIHVCCTCAPAGKPEDMVLMHSFWQLADIHLCILRMPSLKKVWERHQ